MQERDREPSQIVREAGGSREGTRSHRDTGMGDINIVEGDIGNADAFVHFSVLSWKLPRAEDTLQGEATWPPRSQRLWLQVTDL